MLQKAVKAELPIITVTTKDTLNYKDVLKHLIPDIQMGVGVKQCLTSAGKVFMVSASGAEYSVLYNELIFAGKTVIIVNPATDIPVAFDAGELPTPKKLVIEELGAGGFDERTATKFLPALSNLNLKQIGEVCKLAMVEFDELTAQGITSIKQAMFPNSTGLIQVDSTYDFYMPSKELKEIAINEKDFFLEQADHRLIPRGVLLNGMPGVGKSMGAKYFAKRWGVPLFLLDLSSVMGKYVGQSEQGMMQMLRTIDEEAPAILLIDEIEKLFKSKDDSGTTSRLLGQLLWWLQEHKSRIYTVMTCNDIETIPDELYRVGRIDEVLILNGFGHKTAQSFVENYLNLFCNLELPESAGQSITVSLWDALNKNEKGHRLTPAELIGGVHAYVKAFIVQNRGGV